jgi:hypoxanthine phosphoribosyltransferase
MFTPDFYLPDQDLYVELTTMKQSLVTKKNRKVRRLRELYPELQIKLMYRRDYQQLVAQYGYGALEITELQPEQIDRILVSPSELQERVVSLGEQISADYADRTIMLVGVLKGVTFFLADLARAITRPLAIDYLAVAGYGTPPKGRSRSPGAVRIIKDLDEQITGQHIVLVEDIVNTGLSLQYILKHLRAKRPASIAVCTLLDKSEKRLVDVPLDYVGFPCPNEFVIGYGLDYRERYRNLPFLCVLKPEAYEQSTPLRTREDVIVPEAK